MADKESLSGPSFDEAGALKAVTDSINQMAGSLTGRNLEQKIHEYTSVYGEILLGMHNRLNDMEREVRSLRKELKQQQRHMATLEKQAEQTGSSSSGLLPILSLAFSALALLSVLWLLLQHTNG